MKKTGIVSCYFYHNYGSILQAYATQAVLDKLGVSNETINVSGLMKQIKREQYKYYIKAALTSDFFITRIGKIKNVFYKRIIKNEYTLKIPIRDAKFEEFIDKHIKLSRRYSSKDELTKECDKKYSNVLVGSDQLWLPANIAADYYTLSFVPDSVNSISYATSFGVSVLPKDIIDKTQKFLNRIKHVSVREISGQTIIKEVTGRNVSVVCDPTMLLTSNEWLSIQQEEPLIKEKYIFCYFIGNDVSHREFVKRLKNETHLKVVALVHIDNYIKCDVGYADETPYDVGPSEFINLICNAEYVCTDSFHCSVFSILNHRLFFAFRRYKKDTRQSTNNRLETLYHLLGLEERLRNGKDDVKECLKLKINYDEVEEKLEKLRHQSYKYLENALRDGV